MCHTNIKTKVYCLQAFAIILAWMGRQLHASLDKLNSIWYRFSLYTLVEVARWPNQTTGALQPISKGEIPVNRRMPRQETWV